MNIKRKNYFGFFDFRLLKKNYCPKCGQKVAVGKNYYYCIEYKKTCDFISGKTILGTKISEANMKKILQGKCSNLLTFKKVDDKGEKKTWKAALVYHPEKQQITFQFEDEDNKRVPNLKLSSRKTSSECAPQSKQCRYIVGPV